MKKMLFVMLIFCVNVFGQEYKKCPDDFERVPKNQYRIKHKKGVYPSIRQLKRDRFEFTIDTNEHIINFIKIPKTDIAARGIANPYFYWFEETIKAKKARELKYKDFTYETGGGPIQSQGWDRRDVPYSKIKVIHKQGDPFPHIKGIKNGYIIVEMDTFTTRLGINVDVWENLGNLRSIFRSRYSAATSFPIFIDCHER